ncbi:hypothetical protein A3715_04780 [Oleiphilus sp. HI0009]|nr:hypothetical protein A3715_04780 [Oleiphilus sp. HI0009]
MRVISDKLINAGVYVSVESLVKLSSTARRLSYFRARVVKQQQAGSHHSRFKGRGMEFAEVRPYQAGDDVRSIDWRVTARKQSTHTKLFQEERERPVVVICDQSASMFFGSRGCLKSVLAARCAALLSWSAYAHNDRVGGIIFNDQQLLTIKPGRNRKSILQYINHVVASNNELSAETSASAPQLNRNQQFTLALKEACQVIKPGTLIFVISDYHKLDATGERHLNTLAKHNELVLLRCTDPLEKNLPTGGALPVSDGDHTFYIRGQDEGARKVLSNWDEAITNRVEQLSRNRNVNAWELNTNLDFEHQLAEISRQVSLGASSR